MRQNRDGQRDTRGAKDGHANGRPSKSRKSQRRQQRTDVMEEEQEYIQNKHGGRHTTNDSMELASYTSRSTTSSSDLYRRELLASVGYLDDDDEEDVQTHQQQNDGRSNRKSQKVSNATQKSHRDTSKSGRIRNNQVASHGRGTAQSQMYDYDEEDARSEEEEAELLDDDDEYDSSPYTNESSPRSLISTMLNKLIWMLAVGVVVVYIFYNDEKLASDETEEDTVAKGKPYSYEGFKDGRIPDDDLAQYAGGLLYNDALPSNDDESDQKTSGSTELTYHPHTGNFQVDSLWEDLEGLAEMAEPYNPTRDVPVFWHVPKCGGTTLQDLMMHCFGMIGANEIGGAYVKDTGPLEVVKLDNGNRYVNVDMSNPDGIGHAQELGFGQSGLADVIMTSWLHPTAIVFGSGGDDVDDTADGYEIHRGRCFTLVRHPIRRAISMFYYLKDATWEHTFSEVYKTMTIEEYAESQYSEDNWMGECKRVMRVLYFL
eukprot:g12180.t1.1.5e17418b g12180  g12180.t1 contig6:1386227-1387766(-)